MSTCVGRLDYGQSFCTHTDGRKQLHGLFGRRTRQLLRSLDFICRHLAFTFPIPSFNWLAKSFFSPRLLGPLFFVLSAPVRLATWVGSKGFDRVRWEGSITIAWLARTDSSFFAPCKPALNDYFVAIFQVAPNRLKFGMSTLCVDVPVGFFQECRNIWTKLCQIQPPPPPPPIPPSLSVSKQRRISIFEGQNTVNVSFTLFEISI